MLFRDGPELVLLIQKDDIEDVSNYMANNARRSLKMHGSPLRVFWNMPGVLKFGVTGNLSIH